MLIALITGAHRGSERFWREIQRKSQENPFDTIARRGVGTLKHGTRLKTRGLNPEFAKKERREH